MAVGAAAIAVAGTVMSVSANNKKVAAQTRAARSSAQAKRDTAFEILARAEENAEFTRFEAEGFKQNQVTDLVKRGFGDTLNVLAVLEDTNSKVSRQLDIERREVEFKAGQLFAGADVDTRLASDIREAGRLENIGLFLSGVSRAGFAAT